MSVPPNPNYPIVEALRNKARRRSEQSGDMLYLGFSPDNTMEWKAADEIERLERVNEHLGQAVQHHAQERAGAVERIEDQLAEQTRLNDQLRYESDQLNNVNKKHSDEVARLMGVAYKLSQELEHHKADAARGAVSTGKVIIEQADEISRLTEWVNTLRNSRVALCEWCGQQYSPTMHIEKDDLNKLYKAHSLVCEKHPMRDREKEIMRLTGLGPEGVRSLFNYQKEIERLTAWINDLQSGMYINCTYCGHRSGPPHMSHGPSVQELLTKHIEECPKHPLFELRLKHKELQEMFDRTLADYTAYVKQANDDFEQLQKECDHYKAVAQNIVNRDHRRRARELLPIPSLMDENRGLKAANAALVRTLDDYKAEVSAGWADYKDWRVGGGDAIVASLKETARLLSEKATEVACLKQRVSELDRAAVRFHDADNRSPALHQIIKLTTGVDGVVAAPIRHWARWGLGIGGSPTATAHIPGRVRANPE